jgi:hypothetical protein
MAPPAAAVSASKAASSGASLTARRAAMDIASMDSPSRQFANAKSVSQKSALGNSHFGRSFKMFVCELSRGVHLALF